MDVSPCPYAPMPNQLFGCAYDGMPMFISTADNAAGPTLIFSVTRGRRSSFCVLSLLKVDVSEHAEHLHF